MINNDENEKRIALNWIKMIESERGKIRATDIYPKLRSFLDNDSTKRILEIGSGQGICSDNIDLTNRTYTGIDLSPLLISRANQLYPFPNRTFVVGSAYSLPLEENSLDAAFSVSVWHLLEDINKAAVELSRVLKSNGRFLIITANPNSYHLWKASYSEIQLDGARLEGKFELEDKSIVSEVLYLHSFDEITNSLKSANLKINLIEEFRETDASKGHPLYLSIQGQKSY